MAGSEQLEDPSGDLMMLPTDYALVQDDKFKSGSKSMQRMKNASSRTSKAYVKLNELGCKNLKSNKAWYQFW